ncbi:DUF262 domain-containing protein [Paratractidigestivibacter sp.]|uniref:DUF262 domain-containing protein n=1 Tax=Paratractidigestivibacter sp. TaxID=2847316 RepID=UPI002AC92593|nr:DUF262 domain-containing protein [Paratractidigestivibacter sp.]
MRGGAKPLVKMMQGAETRFVIPVYQRNYDWKREQCKRLFDDLEEVVHEGRASHFFGSIVSKADMERRVLIDGQQRVTTTFVLLAALCRQIEAGAIESENPEKTARYIRNQWLIDEYDEVEKLKLKLVKGDQLAFRRVIEGDPDKLVSGSNVTENYRYFLDRISGTDLTAEQLRDAIKSLEVIDISLEQGDNAQLIFESLNSTGLDLSEGDKIRNYVLMDLPEKTQEQCYEKYWNPIEVNTDYDVSSFIRDYLAAVMRKTPAIRRVYHVFREFAAGKDSEALLSELLRYSEICRKISDGKVGSAKIDPVLTRLGLMNMGVTNPYLLSALVAYEDGKVGESDLAEALRAMEIYLFRRWVAEVPTNALNKVFEMLHWDAMRGVGDGASYADAAKYALLRRDGSGRLPDDKEFRDGYERTDFYNTGRWRSYLYERLENGDSVERMDVVGMLESGAASVEHVMPQTLSRAWRNALGDHADEIHERWLNTMGNLTLTGYNSQYSNNPFEDKRDRENGFKDSHYSLNSFIASCEEWGPEQMEERYELMWERFLELWPMPSTDYVPTVREHESHGLDEDYGLTGRKLAAYSFLGARHTTKNWVDMIQGVLRELYVLDPAGIRAVATGLKFPARYFSEKPLDYGFEVGGAIWFNPGCSTSTKCDALRRVIDRVDGVEYSDLTFEVYDEKESGE